MEYDSISNTDRNIINRLLRIDHDSGGKFSMLATSRDCPSYIGVNSLFKRGFSDAPDWAGRHAEAHLASLVDLKGKTIYVAGRAVSGNVMANTMPCNRCLKMLLEIGTRAVVYMQDSSLKKSYVSDLSDKLLVAA